MHNSIRIISFVSLLTLVLSSCCFGLAVVHPVECKNETPTTHAHDVIWSKSKIPQHSTKAEFLKEWGQPAKIISTSENEETWIYERHLWCGAVPAFVLPVPLILPVCDGFDHIEFKGNVATRLHTRRTVTGGVIFCLSGPIGAGSDPACRYPLPPDDVVGSNAAKPATEVTP